MSNQPEPNVGCLVLASGEGARFPEIKQLAPLNGRFLLDHPLSAALASKCKRTIVTLGAHAGEISRRIDFRSAETLLCSSWKEGMSSSLRLGLRGLSDVDAVVILLGDQPLIGSNAVDRLIDARGGGHLTVRSTYSGVPGHPVLLERGLFGRIEELRGDLGARLILVDSKTREVPCEDIANPMDVDTLADLQNAERAMTQLPGSA